MLSTFAFDATTHVEKITDFTKSLFQPNKQEMFHQQTHMTLSYFLRNHS